MTDINYRIINGEAQITLTVEGMTLTGTLNTNTARALALDILDDQGPYLTYQPPNDSMKERAKSTPVKRDRERRHRRQGIRRYLEGDGSWLLEYQDPADVYQVMREMQEK